MRPRRRPERIALTYFFAIFLACGASVARAQVDYEAGRGLRLLDQRLIIGGYLGIEGQAVEGAEDRVSLSALSTFVSFDFTPRLSLFTELELEESLRADDDGVHTGDDVFALERLYLEYEPMESLGIRGGQFLTPIGIWNEVHALPLVWTTSRPAATIAYFDPTVTGIELKGRVRISDLDLAVTSYGQATRQIDETGKQQKSRRGGGVRLQLGSVDTWHVGTSGMRFRDHRDRRWENVAGADFLFTNDDWEITGEFALNSPDSGSTTWAIYVQAVYALGANFFSVLRYEHSKTDNRSDDPVVIGLAYKPWPHVILKAEGVIGRGVASDSGEDLGIGNGTLASFSMLF